MKKCVLLLLPILLLTNTILAQNKTKKQATTITEVPDEEKPNLATESLFKGIFIGGLNISQVDGDLDFGYRKVGAHVGVGTMIKFSKRFSVSMELLYSMKGAKPRYSKLLNGQKDKFNITLDYIEIPLSINVHDKKLVYAGAGLTFGALMNYKEITTLGTDTTNSPPPFQQPRKFDLSVHAGVTFLIKQQIGIGVRFSYSVLALRDAYLGSKLKGQYNNVFSFRLSYILDPKKMKSKRK